jgi:hypothetical protein
MQKLIDYLRSPHPQKELEKEESIERRLAYLRENSRTFEDKLGDFLAYPNDVPLEDYMAALGSDRVAVLTKAREAAQTQLKHFKAFTEAEKKTGGRTDYVSVAALESLVYAGDQETLREIKYLWENNAALCAHSASFKIILRRTNQPNIALIIGPTLQQGVGLLDQASDISLSEKLKDRSFRETFERVETASLLFAESVGGNRQLPLAARTWFHDEAKRWQTWFAEKPGKDWRWELARMRWSRARSWYLLNKAAIEEGRYSEVRAPTNPDEVPASGGVKSNTIPVTQNHSPAESVIATAPSAPAPKNALSPDQNGEQRNRWLFVGAGVVAMLIAVAILWRLANNRPAR